MENKKSFEEHEAWAAVNRLGNLVDLLRHGETFTDERGLKILDSAELACEKLQQFVKEALLKK